MSRTYKIAIGIQKKYNDVKDAESILKDYISSDLDDVDVFNAIYDVYNAAKESLIKTLMDFCQVDRGTALAMMASPKFENLMNKTIV